jgi:DNA-3-methyladenine glycosylase
MFFVGDEERPGFPVGGAPPVCAFDVDGPALCPDFFARPAAEVARGLLGTVLVSGIGGVRSAGLIVETEAYFGPEDEASHASARIGRTSRNDAMFGAPGLAYVYRIYGIHWCLNAVTDEEGHPSAVLIRAAMPIHGRGALRTRRPGRPDRDLMRGPGNLCAALGVNGEMNRHPLDRQPLRILRGAPIYDRDIATGPRIGVSRATDLPLRFWLRGSRWVSVRS